MSFGCYEVGETIGRGASSKVKVATHVLAGSNHPVAFKVISKSYVMNSPEGRLEQNALTEVAIMKRLDHPHIVRLYEAVQTRRDLVLVLEYFEGGELLDFITNNRKLNEQRARSLFQQITAAVEHCHLHGVVHRDLKPENLLLSGDHRVVKIADFGLSATLHDGRCLTASCGSPNYSAPEVFNGTCYGAEVDLWSLGVVLYTMVSGRLPFDSEQMSELKQQVCTADFEMPRFLSAECKDLLRRLLVVDPLERATIQQVKDHPWVRPHFPLYLLRINEDVIGRARVSQALRGLKNPALNMSPGVVSQIMTGRSTGEGGSVLGNAAPFGKSPIQPPETASILLSQSQEKQRGGGGLFGATPLAHLSVGETTCSFNAAPRGGPLLLSAGCLQQEAPGGGELLEAAPVPKLSALDELVVNLLFYSPVNSTEGASGELLDQNLVDYLLHRSGWLPHTDTGHAPQKPQSPHSESDVESDSDTGSTGTPSKDAEAKKARRINREVEERVRLCEEMRTHFQDERCFREEAPPRSLEAAALVKGGIPFADPLLNKREHTLWVGYDILSHHRAMRNPMLLESLKEAETKAPTQKSQAREERRRRNEERFDCSSSDGSVSAASTVNDSPRKPADIDPGASGPMPIRRKSFSSPSPSPAQKGAGSSAENALTLGFSARQDSPASFGVQFPIAAVPSPGPRGSGEATAQQALLSGALPNSQQGMASGPSSFLGASAPMEHNGLNAPLGASYGMLRQVAALVPGSSLPPRDGSTSNSTSSMSPLTPVGKRQRKRRGSVILNATGIQQPGEIKKGGSDFARYSLHRTQRQSRMSLFDTGDSSSGPRLRSRTGPGEFPRGLSSSELGCLLGGNLNNHELFGASVGDPALVSAPPGAASPATPASPALPRPVTPPPLLGPSSATQRTVALRERAGPGHDEVMPLVLGAGALPLEDSLRDDSRSASHSGSRSATPNSLQGNLTPVGNSPQALGLDGGAKDSTEDDCLVLPRGVMRLGMLLSEITITSVHATPEAEQLPTPVVTKSIPRTPRQVMNVIYDALIAEGMLWRKGRDAPFSIVALAPNGKGKIFVAIYRTVVAQQKEMSEGFDGDASFREDQMTRVRGEGDTSQAIPSEAQKRKVVEEDEKCFVIDIRISRFGGHALLDAAAALYHRLVSLAHVDVIMSTPTDAESPGDLPQCVATKQRDGVTQNEDEDVET